MTTILEANKIGKYYSSEPTIEGISFKLNAGEKVGLVGENGCGKSTLLKLIAGLETITEGHLSHPRDTPIGYLAQELHYTEGNSVYQELLDVFAELRLLEKKLEHMQQEMATTAGSAQQKLLDEYGSLAAEYEERGGYTYTHQIETIMTGLGLVPKRERPVAALSGGEKNVLALARILLQEPDILLLDEPANHLDFAGLEWLEKFLADYPRTVLLVSHNRYLLDQVVKRTLEIETRSMSEYAGNYSYYREEKQRRLLQQQAQYQTQQKEIRRLEGMIARFERWGQMSDDPRIATRRKNKERMIDRMDKIERPDLDKKHIDPRFDAADKGGRIALELKKYTREIGGKELFTNVDLHIGYGERVGLLGANGSGKSTLFRDIVQEAAWDHPVLRIGPQVRLGYYAQEHETLDLGRTIMAEMQQQRGLTKDRAFSILSRFLFRWQDMDQCIGTLSGGQKSRVQLAKLMAADVNFLLLDEPTNHLDIYSREHVENALEAFKGTILVISHDRYFLDRIVERIVEVDEKTLVDHEGNFSEYWRRKKEKKEQQTLKKTERQQKKKEVTSEEQLEKRTARPSYAQAKAQTDIEEELEILEEEKDEIEAALTSAYEANEHDVGDELSQELRAIEEQIEELYEQWEKAIA
ncbi:MAG: ATP-binding cassette subfamily F protein 3 [Candidatus Latescibacterota bacterium]|jgi:ATP-binding cassette subfamily F protein 3